MLVNIKILILLDIIHLLAITLEIWAIVLSVLWKVVILFCWIFIKAETVFTFRMVVSIIFSGKVVLSLSSIVFGIWLIMFVG